MQIKSLESCYRRTARHTCASLEVKKLFMLDLCNRLKNSHLNKGKLLRYLFLYENKVGMLWQQDEMDGE